MKKHRVNTTISQKHYALLKKHAEKFGTQQGVLEHALEALESNINQNIELSPEEVLWSRVGKIKSICILGKDLLKMLMETADIKQFQELVNRDKPNEFSIEYYFQKPLKECSLEEVIEGLVINARLVHWLDTVDYIDNGDYYMLNMTHSLNLNSSKYIKISHESVFKTYGVDFNTTISEKTVFMKIFKK